MRLYIWKLINFDLEKFEFLGATRFFFVIQVFHGKAKLSDLWQLVQQFSLIYWKKTCGPLGYLLGVSCFDLELGILHKMPIIEF